MGQQLFDVVIDSVN